jgi:tol-pal system protein YbgF
MKKTAPILSLCCLFILLGGCALQQDVIILEERLIALENQNLTLQRQNERLQGQLKDELKTFGSETQSKEKNLRSQFAGMNVSLETLQQDIRTLNGRIEEIDYAVKRKLDEAANAGTRMDEVSLRVAKLEQRLDQLEQYLNLNESGKADLKQKTSNSAYQSQENSERQLYDNAKQAFDNGQLDKARQGFHQFISTYPKSANVDNAQFWIGESYYREKWYEKAILEYQTVIEKYPKGNKVASAMLKQGMAFLQLGDQSNARLILKELEKKYPKSKEAQIATKKLSEF